MSGNHIVKVVIDEDFIKEEASKQIKEMLNGFDFGCWWDLKRLEQETNRKREWLLNNILLNPKFKKEMQQISNMCESGRWMFRAKAMISFLDNNFHELNKSREKGESA